MRHSACGIEQCLRHAGTKPQPPYLLQPWQFFTPLRNKLTLLFGRKIGLCTNDAEAIPIATFFWQPNTWRRKIFGGAVVPKRLHCAKFFRCITSDSPDRRRKIASGGSGTFYRRNPLASIGFDVLANQSSRICLIAAEACPCRLDAHHVRRRKLHLLSRPWVDPVRQSVWRTSLTLAYARI
jgi:hypothetical protein